MVVENHHSSGAKLAPLKSVKTGPPDLRCPEIEHLAIQQLEEQTHSENPPENRTAVEPLGWLGMGAKKHQKHGFSQFYPATIGI